MRTEKDDRTVYVTEVEQEAYDLGGQLCLANVRSHVEHHVNVHGKPFYTVIAEAVEAMDRARMVRRQMFGS